MVTDKITGSLLRERLNSFCNYGYIQSLKGIRTKSHKMRYQFNCVTKILLVAGVATVMVGCGGGGNGAVKTGNYLSATLVGDGQSNLLSHFSLGDKKTWTSDLKDGTLTLTASAHIPDGGNWTLTVVASNFTPETYAQLVSLSQTTYIDLTQIDGKGGVYEWRGETGNMVIQGTDKPPYFVSKAGVILSPYQKAGELGTGTLTIQVHQMVVTSG